MKDMEVEHVPATNSVLARAKSRWNTQREMETVLKSTMARKVSWNACRGPEQEALLDCGKRMLESSGRDMIQLFHQTTEKMTL